MRHHHGRLRQRLAVVARASFATLLAGVVAAPVGHAETPPMQQIRTTPYSGPAVVDPAARLWYETQLPNASPAVYQVQTRNLDTLQPRHVVKLPGTGVLLRAVHQPVAVNKTRTQLYAVYYDSENAPRIAVVDGRAGKLVGDFGAFANAPDGVVRTIFGLGYEARSDSLYVAWQVDTTPVLNKAVSTELKISEIDGKTGDIRWTQSVDGCTAFTTRTLNGEAGLAAIFPSRLERALYFSCRAAKPGRTGADVGSSFAVKMIINNDGTRTTRMFLAPGAPSAMAFAPATDRMMLGVGFGTQNGVLVFDGRAEAFIGLVPGDIGTMGVNEETGRLYACANAVGLQVADAGIAVPVPLGEQFTEIGCHYAGAPVIVDPERRLVYVYAQDSQGKLFWRIVRDNSAPYRVSPPDNPDIDTVDVAERPGVTTSSFAAAGAAYGTRLIMVGGPRGWFENVATPAPYQVLLGVSEGLYEATTSSPTGPISQDPPNVVHANREVWLGRVSKANLDDNSATATGTGADRNDNIDSDLAAISNPNVAGQNPNGGGPKLTWPEQYYEKSCLSFGGTTDKPKETGEGLVLECELGKRVLADAKSPRQTVSIGGYVTVGDSTSTVTLTRDAKLGALSTIVSEAHHVVIGGVAFINDIKVTAKTWAKGRRGTAGSSYEREFSGVRVVGSDGKPVFECGTPDQCDPAGVVAQINRALGNRMRVRLPQPDRVLRGSPGGAKAVIQRDQWQHLEQQTLNNQQVDDTTLPGVEVEAVMDNFSQSRLLVQLAGVYAESTYNISREPRPGEDPQEGGDDVVTIPDTGNGGSGSTGGDGDDDGDETVTTANPPGTTTQTFIEKVRSGMRWAFGWNDGTPLVFVTWAMFGVPVYLGVRRRLLGHALKGGL